MGVVEEAERSLDSMRSDPAKEESVSIENVIVKVIAWHDYVHAGAADNHWRYQCIHRALLYFCYQHK